jgi:non-specific serine/threonine protein kinase
MAREEHERAEAIFLAARKCDFAARARLLDRLCGEDAELRRHVEEMLAGLPTEAAWSDDETGSFPTIALPLLAPPSPFGPGAMLEGKIRIEGVLGEGGMGTVYRGVHVALERPVAVKLIRPSLVRMPGAVERLRREALAVARLRHPNVVAVYDFGSSEATGAYIVMEYVDGETLADVLAREKPMRLAAADELLAQIAAAAHAAHEVGVVHRDLKPQNILLEKGAAPRVKVLDFGVAKLLEAQPAGPASTVDGVFIGTPLYGSPEQANGTGCDARSDVYALGCILYEMVAGRPPFVGPGVQRILAQHASERPEPPSRLNDTLPEWLDAVVMRALDKSPEKRFQTAAGLAEALTARIGGEARTTGETGMATVASDGALRPPNNLPAPLTSFVGREREVDALVEAAARASLVTLVGPGGVGKTRLALRAAGALLDRSATTGTRFEECWYVDLAPVADAPGVARTLAAVVGARADSDEELAGAIASRLAPLRALVVVDNCEHLAAACARLLAPLLATCPGLRVLATSRAKLHVAGESIFTVEPLALGSAGGVAGASEAARLFVDRAKLVAADFRPTERDLATIAEICGQVDGLPLAIELAAARVRILSVHQIRDRLRDRLRLLTSAETTGRHESLRAAIDWSYGMLGESEAALFARLSVFAGGLTIDAAEIVCEGGAVAAFDALDLIAGLADKSLVAVARGEREARYLLLDTIREYAAEKLGAEDEALFRARHRDYYLEMAETAARELHGREGSTWGARLETEINNLRAALAWSRDEEGDGVAFLRLAVALHVFFYERGYLGEGRDWLEAAIARAGDEAPVALRTLALTAAGNFALDQGDVDAARALQERSLEISREAGDAAGIASGLHNLGNILQHTGDYAGARARFEESLGLCRELDRPHNVALSLYTQACVALETAEWQRAGELLAESRAIYASIEHAYGLSLVGMLRAYEAALRGDMQRVESLLDEALDLATAADNRHNVSAIPLYRANVARHAGRFDDAEAHGAAALAAFRALGDKDCAAATLYVLARTARARGDLALAASRNAECLALRVRMGQRKGLAECFEEGAANASASGDAARGARLLGAADAIRREIGAPVYPVDTAERAAERAAIRAALGDAPFAAAFADGARLSERDAVALA